MDPGSKKQMAEQLGHFWSLNLVRVMVILSPALTARAVGLHWNIRNIGTKALL